MYTYSNGASISIIQTRSASSSKVINMPVSNSEPEKLMDFDSIHGTSLTDPAKPLVLYWNRRKTIAGLKKRSKRIISILVLLIALIYITSYALIYPDDLLLSVFFGSTCSVGCLIFLSSILSALSHDINTSTEPLLELTSNGLRVSCPRYYFDSIPWQLIKHVEVEPNCGKPLLSIIPEDEDGILEFARKDSTKIGNHLLLPQYKTVQRCKSRWGKFVLAKYFFSKSRILIPEEWLPLSASEVKDLIDVRLNHDILKRLSLDS